MALFPDWLPWLDKQAAVREVGRMIVASGAVTNALIGFAAVDGREARVVPARRDRDPVARDRAAARVRPGRRPAGQPRPGARASLPQRPRSCLRARSCSSSPTSCRPRVRRGCTTRSRRAGTSSPSSSRIPSGSDRSRTSAGVTLPLVDPDDRTRSLVRLSRKEARARRELNEQRAAAARPRAARARARPRGRSRAATDAPCTPRFSPGQKGDDEGREARGERGRPAEAGGRSRGSPVARLLAIGLIVGASIAAALAVFLVDRPASTARLLDGPITVKRALSTLGRAVRRSRRGRDRRLHERRERPAPVGARRRRASGRTGSRRPGSTREHEGDISLLRTRITLQCLTRACLPPRGGGRVVRFRPFAVTYRRGGQERTGARALGAPPGLLAAPAGRRGTRRDRGHRAAARAGVRPVARDGAGAVARRRGACSASRALRSCSRRSGRRRTRRSGAWRRLSPLERSLLRVEAAAANDDEAARRRTLDDLATRLGGVPAPALERRTRALAWGQSPPEPEALVLLAEQVRAALNGGVRA